MCGSDHASAYWSMYSPMLRRDTSAADEAPRSERCNQSAFPPLQTDERALRRNQEMCRVGGVEGNDMMLDVHTMMADDGSKNSTDDDYTPRLAQMLLLRSRK